MIREPRTTANPPNHKAQTNHFAMDAVLPLVTSNKTKTKTPEKSHGYRVRIRRQYFPSFALIPNTIMVGVIIVVVVATIIRIRLGAHHVW
jgi:hypothetical protein